MRGFKSARALDVYHLILAATNACNLRCKHCYLPDHSAQLLPKSLALRLVDEWSALVMRERGQYKGIFHLKGGEPLVTPYLFDLVDRIAELRTLWFMMTTNGTLLKTENFENLDYYNQKLSGHLTVVVSVDGATAETHDYLRGIGTFDKTIRSIRELRRRDVQVYLNSVIHQGNLHELPQFMSMAKALDVAQINFLPLVPKGYGATLRQNQASHLEIHQRLAIVYNEGDSDTRRLMAGGLPDIQHYERSAQFATCSECVAGYRGLFYIKPDGSVYSCPNLEQAHFSVANVYTDSLQVASDRLWKVHHKLRAMETDDRYICSGERIRYEEAMDTTNIENLAVLRATLSKEMPLCEQASKVAFCVSRNW